MQDGMDRQAETRHTVVVLTNFVTSFEIHVNKKTCQTTTALYIIQGRRNDFESGGARPLSSKKSGGAQARFYPISTKKWWGPGPTGPYPSAGPVVQYT